MNNPPAFPQIPTGNTISTGPQFGCDIHSNYEGMSIRDWFAGMALHGQIDYEGLEGCDKTQIAGMCYEIADAMLAQREKGKV